MFKWVCLLVAVAALSAYGWMLNDVRLQIRDLSERAEKQIPPLLTQAQRVTELLDQHLPKLLSQSEQAATTVNTHLPRLLVQTEKTVETVNNNLPELLASTEKTMDNLGELSDSFKQYKGLMGIVHAATQNKELFSYGSSILNWVGGLEATIGVKKAGAGPGLRQAVPAQAWASGARKDAHFLSLGATSKADLLHGLARTHSAQPLYIQLAGQAPRTLADLLKDSHPESKDVK